MNAEQKWNAEQYDHRLGFVSRFGKGLLQLLDAQPGESILDLGCGTGDLTNEIAKTGALVTGLDCSPDMISRAKHKYPELPFILDDGQRFRLARPESVDAVFSNAALHWMRDAAAVAESVWLALRPGGRFVAEFGGKHNVYAITQAIEKVLSSEYGLDAAQLNPWYFPSIGEYAALLEKQGFRVAFAEHFDRPTQLEDGENGMELWLDQFGGVYFASISMEQKQTAYGKIMELVRPELYNDHSWTADYRRIRIAAYK